MRKDLRCTCKKLLFQVDGDDIIIKCRHCKKIIIIRTKGLVSMEYRIEEQAVKLNSCRESYQSH